MGEIGKEGVCQPTRHEIVVGTETASPAVVEPAFHRVLSFGLEDISKAMRIGCDCQFTIAVRKTGVAFPSNEMLALLWVLSILHYLTNSNLYTNTKGFLSHVSVLNRRLERAIKAERGVWPSQVHEIKRSLRFT